MLDCFLNFPLRRSQDLRCEHAVRQQCWWYPPPRRSVQELVINEHLLHSTQSVVLLLSLHKQGLHLLRWIEAFFFAYPVAVRYLQKVTILMDTFWCCHCLRNGLCHFLRNSSGVMSNLCKDSTNKGVIIKQRQNLQDTTKLQMHEKTN